MKPFQLLFLFLFAVLTAGCKSCCDEDVPFLSTEALRAHIPYAPGEVIVFLKNGQDTVPMEVMPDQVDSSGFGSPVYGGCKPALIEYREVRLTGTSQNIGFSIGLSGDRDTIVNIGNYTSANLLIDPSGHFLCRPPSDGSQGKVTCLDSIQISGKSCYDVIRHIDQWSYDTLYYSPEFGILKINRQGGVILERLW